MVGLADSPYLPATDSCLVFIETNDSRVDRITDELTRLARAGVFDRAAGLVFGRPVGVDRPADLYRALTRLALEYSLPALADVDIGHTVPILTLPIGVTATIDTDSRMLRLDEAAVVSDG
jgi:muramoyltetrapeptide carboxypeptidase